MLKAALSLHRPTFDLVRMVWENCDARGKQPSARYWHTATLAEGKLFVICGYNGKRSLDDMHVLDTEAMIWSQPATSGSRPGPLANHTCTLVAQRLYVCGGMVVSLDESGGSFVKYSDDVYILDAEAMLWERLRRRGSQPAARAYHETLQVGGYLLVLGGWSGSAEGLGELNTLDLEGLGSWYTVEVPGQAPPSTYGHSATLIGTKVVLFGGWDSVSPLNSVRVLDTTVL